MEQLTTDSSGKSERAQLESPGRSQAKNRAIGYFPLCRQLGARAVDGLVRGRILELRWTDSVTPEGDPDLMTFKESKRRGHAEEMVGPVLLPTTPVMRSAMAKVLQELKDESAEKEAAEAAGKGGGERRESASSGAQ